MISTKKIKKHRQDLKEWVSDLPRYRVGVLIVDDTNTFDPFIRDAFGDSEHIENLLYHFMKGDYKFAKMVLNTADRYRALNC